MGGCLHLVPDPAGPKDGRGRIFRGIRPRETSAPTATLSLIREGRRVGAVSAQYPPAPADNVVMWALSKGRGRIFRGIRLRETSAPTAGREFMSTLGGGDEKPGGAFSGKKDAGAWGCLTREAGRLLRGARVGRPSGAAFVVYLVGRRRNPVQGKKSENRKGRQAKRRRYCGDLNGLRQTD